MNKLIRTTKEAARHILHIAGLRNRSEHYLQPSSRMDRFRKIYEAGVWQLGDPTLPLSGRGSSLEATATIRDQLPALLEQIGTRTLLDIGCGDMTWMGTLDVGDYIGVDIVPSVIADNQARFPDRRFLCLDAVTDPLPEANVVLCREVLFHLSFKDALALIKNVRKTPRDWLIATIDTATLVNADIQTGDFRMLNLRKSPFYFPEPQHVIADDSHTAGRYLAAFAGVGSTSAIHP